MCMMMVMMKKEWILKMRRHSHMNTHTNKFNQLRSQLEIGQKGRYQIEELIA